MRYCKRIDLWRAMPQTIAAMQPGQHVSAGGASGVWAGLTGAGVKVVMWEGSARGTYRSKYFRALRQYALANS